MKCFDFYSQNQSKPENSHTSEMFMSNINVESLMYEEML